MENLGSIEGSIQSSVKQMLTKALQLIRFDDAEEVDLERIPPAVLKVRWKMYSIIDGQWPLELTWPLTDGKS